MVSAESVSIHASSRRSKLQPSRSRGPQRTVARGQKQRRLDSVPAAVTLTGSRARYRANSRSRSRGGSAACLNRKHFSPRGNSTQSLQDLPTSAFNGISHRTWQHRVLRACGQPWHLGHVRSARNPAGAVEYVCRHRATRSIAAKAHETRLRAWPARLLSARVVVAVRRAVRPWPPS